jgi:hypothetical protein
MQIRTEKKQHLTLPWLKTTPKYSLKMVAPVKKTAHSRLQVQLKVAMLAGQID